MGDTGLPFTRFEKFLARVVAPRMGIWLYVSLALLALVWWFAAPMLKVILYKAVILTLTGFLGDKIARAMEGKNPRPHELLEDAQRLKDSYLRVYPDFGGPPVAAIDRIRELERRADAVLYRRALIIAAAMVAGALGT